MKSINTLKFGRKFAVGGPLAAALCAPLVFGCMNADDGEDTEEPRSGLLIEAQVQWTPEVAGMKYEAKRVSCSGERFDPAVYRATVGLEDLKLPSGIPAFEETPFDPESEHMFADHFFVLPAGCYDVTATPLRSNGKPSRICYSAHQSGVQVKDGLTTEITLISQCLGPARGGLDAVIALNNPPVIEDLDFDPSKFVSSCDGVEVCVSASDPDGDPLEFEWKQTGGPAMHYGPTVLSTTINNGITKQCVLVQTGDVETYDLKVTAYDLAWYEDHLVRIEELLADQGDPHQSRDDLQFPLHAATACPVQGRSLIIMLTMRNTPGLSIASSRRLAKNAVDWVYGKSAEPKVLVVLDDAHHGENASDALFVRNQLIAAGFTDVHYINEPASGLRLSNIAGYDVVWFSNPGYPMDDPATQSALLAYRAQGGGVILQGDDMGHFATGASIMEPLNYLHYINNGTMSCGVLTDNNLGGSYKVMFDGDASHPVLAGLAGTSFLYGNDIDHTTPIGRGEQVLASASFSAGKCTVHTNAIIAIDPAMALPWVPTP